MKKTLLIVLPLLFIMSCEDDKDDAVVAVEELSIIGTWTVVSVTEYDNLECMGSGETLNETGSMTFTETSADLSITESVSFEDMCSDLAEDEGYGSDGSVYSPSDTLCQLGYGYIGYWYYDYDDFVIKYNNANHAPFFLFFGKKLEQVRNSISKTLTKMY